VRLEWEGMLNVRDLGGIALRDGGFTCSGAVVRSDHPLRLTPRGWEQVAQYGIRTILSLETGGLEGEAAIRANRPVDCPSGAKLTVIRQAIENGMDEEFIQEWAANGLWGTPLYFVDALNRWPRLHGDALEKIARADGPVLMHCGRGHDRTGIMALIVLALADATVEGITEDYLLSAVNLQAVEPDAAAALDAALRRSGTTAYDAIAAAVDVINDDWLDKAKVDLETRGTLREMLRRRPVSV